MVSYLFLVNGQRTFWAGEGQLHSKEIQWSHPCCAFLSHLRCNFSLSTLVSNQYFQYCRICNVLACHSWTCSKSSSPAHTSFLNIAFSHLHRNCNVLKCCSWACNKPSSPAHASCLNIVFAHLHRNRNAPKCHSWPHSKWDSHYQTIQTDTLCGLVYNHRCNVHCCHLVAHSIWNNLVWNNLRRKTLSPPRSSTSIPYPSVCNV